ncbi:MAG: zinc ribbon domain-containing protein [Promethearchaeota archaeon]
MTKKKIIFTYCDYCKKEIENPRKRPLDSLEKTIWTIVIISTLGIALIALLIYKKFIQKPIYCPVCLSKLKVSKEPFIKKEPKLESSESKAETPKEKVLEKVAEIENKEQIQVKKEENKIYCPFCGELIDKDVATCPYCQTVIKL